MSRRLIPALPTLAPVAVAAAGLVGLCYGIVLATTLAPPSRTAGSVPVAGAVPVVDTATGVLDFDGPQVEVRATAASGGPVFIGIARADDVTAYLADVSRSEITRVTDDGRVTAARTGSAPRLPDPTGADIWVASQAGTGTATLTWPDTPGPWRVVIAGDGSSAAPGQISLTWVRAHRSNPAPVVIAVGALLLAGGLVGLVVLVVLRRRRTGAGADGDASPVDADRPAPMTIPVWAPGGPPTVGDAAGDAATRIVPAENTRSVASTGELPVAASTGEMPVVPPDADSEGPEASKTPEAHQ